MNKLELDYDEISGRDDPKQRYRIYKRHPSEDTPSLLAVCESEEDVGVALCTMGREGQLDEVAIGILDSQGEKGQRWLLLPFLPKV